MGITMSELTYAVGDVHGCAQLLQDLMEKIEIHANGRSYELVFLGDYIDKGPDTAATLDIVMRLSAATSTGRVICLKGNHEADLLASLDDDRALRKWLGMGGARVLEEYGASSPDRLPKEVLAWLSRLTMFHEDAHRYFVHAGLDPAFPRERQTDRARLTMRGDFLAHEHDFGRHIIHGHTPQLSGKPDRRRFRTNIDTAAFITGALTAAILKREEGRPVDFLQTDAFGGAH